MPYPTWASAELAVLKEIENNKGSVDSQTVIWNLTKYFPDTTKEELSSRLDSGQLRWANRMRWARQKLVQKGDLDSSVRGVWRTTEKGRKRLQKEWPHWKARYVQDKFDLNVTTPVSRSKISETRHPLSTILDEGAPPYESLQKARDYYAIPVREELISRVLTVSPSIFEGVVAELLKRMGYGEPKVTGRSGDEGIDGYCSLDELGVDKVLFQAKRWKNNVPPDKVQGFIGAVLGKQARGGILISTSDFGGEARKIADESRRIILVNGEMLAELMTKYGLGIKKKPLDVPEIDAEYFEGLG